MGNTRSSEHTSIDWLAKGPLAPHIDAYMQFLANRDYAANTFSNYLGVVSHFAQWMHSRRLRLQSIDEALVAQFLHKHLPRCHCSGPVQRDRRTLRGCEKIPRPDDVCGIMYSGLGARQRR